MTVYLRVAVNIIEYKSLDVKILFTTFFFIIHNYRFFPRKEKAPIPKTQSNRKSRKGII